MAERRMADDLALVGAWAQGDRAAGAELFERHYPGVARFFRNKVEEAAQDDLIHETFLACLKSAASFRGQARFQTYLFGIARHMLTAHLRRLSRNKARLVPGMDLEEMPALSFGLSPVAIVAQHEEQRLLLEALRRIPLIHQIALELHYWEELTAAELGEVLGVLPSTAKTRLHDGRIHLQKQIRSLARSPEALKSTLDNLDGWARRTRAQIVRSPGAAPGLGGT